MEEIIAPVRVSLLEHHPSPPPAQRVLAAFRAHYLESLERHEARGALEEGAPVSEEAEAPADDVASVQAAEAPGELGPSEEEASEAAAASEPLAASPQTDEAQPDSADDAEEEVRTDPAPTPARDETAVQLSAMPDEAPVEEPVGSADEAAEMTTPSSVVEDGLVAAPPADAPEGGHVDPAPTAPRDETAVQLSAMPDEAPAAAPDGAADEAVEMMEAPSVMEADDGDAVRDDASDGGHVDPAPTAPRDETAVQLSAMPPEDPKTPPQPPPRGRRPRKMRRKRK